MYIHKDELVKKVGVRVYLHDHDKAGCHRQNTIVANCESIQFNIHIPGYIREKHTYSQTCPCAHLS